jgi:hypothetical protein
MFIARWDLDKTYLRTEFDSVGALIRTAFERPDQKRTVPGAAALMRQFADAGIAIHILSGSPEQLRSRLVAKLRLDGVQFASLTLKPNLQNILRLRFKALRGQLGYKLPALLQRRCELPSQRDGSGTLIGEALLGDDAEADALVYSLYADICQGLVSDERLMNILRAGGVYEDRISDTVRFASYVEPGAVVERILIHLDRQSSPADFDGFGGRVVPFYNYLQAAFVLHDDGQLPGAGVLAVARDLTTREHFDGGALARSYLDLARRGHVSGRGIESLVQSYADLVRRRRPPDASELGEMIRLLERARSELPPRPPPRSVDLDYEELVQRRWRRKR